MLAFVLRTHPIINLMLKIEVFFLANRREAFVYQGVL